MKLDEKRALRNIGSPEQIVTAKSMEGRLAVPRKRPFRRIEPFSRASQVTFDLPRRLSIITNLLRIHYQSPCEPMVCWCGCVRGGRMCF